MGSGLMERISRPVLAPNLRKIAESILLLIEEAARRGTYVTKYDIVKSIFVADVQHLNTYGRPVTFANYYAMRDGPVPSEVYTLLGEEIPESMTKDIQGWPLWHKERSPSDGVRAVKYVRPRRSANTKVLSETDVSALTQALSVIKAQSFSATRDMTHEHKAYREAWCDDGDKKSYHMSYNLLMDCEDDEVVSDVVHASHYM